MPAIEIVVVPMDLEQPLRRETIERGDLPAMQLLVSGLIEFIDLDDSHATIVCNEEAKILQMPVNHRATALVWAHKPAFRQRDVISGDAFIAGQPDGRGNTKGCPRSLTELLFAEGVMFRAEMQAAGETRWTPDPAVFIDPFSAYVHGLELVEARGSEDQIRVVQVLGDIKD